jgi:hypothetical protein
LNHGIYLVANRRSQEEAANLVYALRLSGCRLPVCLIPFGGRPVDDRVLLREVEILKLESFPETALDLLRRIARLWPESTGGLFRRLLAWFGPFEEFIYADNDLVPMLNWERLFDFLPEHDVVHSDMEYTTGGRYAYRLPAAVEEHFGPAALENLFTTGQFVARKDPAALGTFQNAVDWLSTHPGVAIEVDGSFLHIAALAGNWRVLNLCKDPHRWLSPWAGDYRNSLDVVQKAQRGRPIAHIHYSGWSPRLNKPQEDFLTAHLSERTRLARLVSSGMKELAGWNWFSRAFGRLRKRWESHLGSLGNASRRNA